MKYGLADIVQLPNRQGLCTMEYVKYKGLEENKDLHNFEDGQYQTCLYFGPDKGTRKVWTPAGKVTMYQYGEYTLFDNEAERDIYRAQKAAARAEEIKRNKLIAELVAHFKTKSTEELEQLVAKLK